MRNGEKPYFSSLLVSAPQTSTNIVGCGGEREDCSDGAADQAIAGRPDVMKELRRRTRANTIGVRDCERAKIILQRLDGVGVEAVAAQLKTTPKRVSMWSKRFESAGLAGLEERPGRGRKASIPAPTQVEGCHPAASRGSSAFSLGRARTEGGVARKHSCQRCTRLGNCCAYRRPVVAKNT